MSRAKKRPPNVVRRTPNRFREREVARVMRAAKASGVPVKEITIDPVTGKIAIVVGDPAGPQTGNDLDKWMEKRERDARPA
jgi:hypothetical protein